MAMLGWGFQLVDFNWWIFCGDPAINFQRCSVVRRWTWTFLNTGFSEVLAEDAMLSLAKGLWVCKRQSSKK